MKSILHSYEENSYYEAICKIIEEGKKTPINYSKIAYEKEIARCKSNTAYKAVIFGDDNKAYTDMLITRKLESFDDRAYLKDEKCPCCGKYAMIIGRTIIGVHLEELGDEMSPDGRYSIFQVPDYNSYKMCALCGFAYTDFIDA